MSCGRERDSIAASVHLVAKDKAENGDKSGIYPGTENNGTFHCYSRPIPGVHSRLLGVARFPPAEAEIAAALLVSPPSVNQMVMMLEKKGLISRRPGTPRSIRVLVPESELPPWGSKRAGRSTLSGRLAATTAGGWAPAASSSPPANLYVLAIFLVGGPVGPKFCGKEISRVIEIRGDQTLDQLHQAIFEAYDRWEQHAYEFQFGRRPHDPAGPNYGVAVPAAKKTKGGDARMKTLDELDLKVHRAFGYCSTSGTTGIIRSKWKESTPPSRPFPIRA